MPQPVRFGVVWSIFFLSACSSHEDIELEVSLTLTNAQGIDTIVFSSDESLTALPMLKNVSTEEKTVSLGFASLYRITVKDVDGDIIFSNQQAAGAEVQEIIIVTLAPNESYVAEYDYTWDQTYVVDGVTQSITPGTYSMASVFGFWNNGETYQPINGSSVGKKEFFVSE